MGFILKTSNWLDYSGYNTFCFMNAFSIIQAGTQEKEPAILIIFRSCRKFLCIVSVSLLC